MKPAEYRWVPSRQRLAEFGAHGRSLALYDHWDGLRSEAGCIPGRQHLDPAAVPDLLPGLWMLEVHRVPYFRLKYRLIGTLIARMLTRNLNGQWFDEVNPAFRDNPAYSERYRLTAERRMPSWRRGEALIHNDREYVELENLIVPLARDGVEVDLLLCHTIFYKPDGKVW